jgi:hypothetical protein
VDYDGGRRVKNCVYNSFNWVGGDVIYWDKGYRRRNEFQEENVAFSWASVGHSSIQWAVGFKAMKSKRKIKHRV